MRDREASTRGPHDDWPEVVLVTPFGRGGVAGAVEAVRPALEDRARVWTVTVGRRPGESAGRRALLRDLAALAAVARPGRVVHLHPSLRSRSLALATVLHRFARALGAATVVQVHGWDPGLAARLSRSPALRSALGRGLWSAQVRAAVSAGAVAELGRWGFPAVRLENAFDTRVVPARRVPGPPTVVFLGRLVPEKRPVALVEALARAADPELRLVLAGEGPERGRIAAAIAAGGLEPRVELPGWLGPDQRRELLARASVLVLPSRDEAQPLAVIEALAAGLPVVAGAGGDVEALVGGAGLVLADPTPAALADAIGSVLATPGLGGAAATARVAAHRPEAVADRWVSLYAEALARLHRGG